MKTRNRISSSRCLINANLPRFFAFLMAGLCLTVGTVLGAGEQAKKETKKEVKVDGKQKVEPEEKTLITGSLIPQQAKPNRIPITTSAVIIIGRQDIERSGAVTVLEVLKKHGTGR